MSSHSKNVMSHPLTFKTLSITFGIGVGAAVTALCVELIFASFAQWGSVIPAQSGNDLIEQSFPILIILSVIEESTLYAAVSLSRPIRSFVSVFVIAIGFSLIEISLPLLEAQPRQEVFLHFAPIILLHIATLAFYSSWHLWKRRLALLPGILLHIVFNIAISENSPILLPLAITLSGATLVFSYLAHLGGMRYNEDEIR